MLSSASFAQQYEYKLSEMNSKYTPEYYKYMYDEDNGRLDSTAHYYELDGYVYDTGNKYVYDEQGNECSRRANRSSAATTSTHTPHR